VNAPEPTKVATERRATGELYPELQLAYDYFNQTLFEGVLPPCLITLDRTKRALGYFSSYRYVSLDGALTHQIAMNPAYFSARGVEDTLSTLVHEQVHLWQAEHGKSGRRGYHNAEWGQKMVSLGLIPSSTGRPGGKRTGESVSHYVVDGGPFHVACMALITKDAFRLTWADRFQAARPEPFVTYPADAVAGTPPVGWVPPVRIPDDATDDGVILGAEDGGADLLVAGGGDGDDGVATKPLLPIVWPPPSQPGGVAKPASRNKTPYVCPGCRAKVWGRPSLDLLCVTCSREFEEVV
jgi:hypothetical protein